MKRPFVRIGVPLLLAYVITAVFATGGYAIVKSGTDGGEA